MRIFIFYKSTRPNNKTESKTNIIAKNGDHVCKKTFEKQGMDLVDIRIVGLSVSQNLPWL